MKNASTARYGASITTAAATATGGGTSPYAPRFTWMTAMLSASQNIGICSTSFSRNQAGCRSRMARQPMRCP